MEGVEDESFDFVHSSHCLEHLVEPQEGLANWFRILRPGGHLVITVPDEDLYEQGVFPSTFNSDHKWTFSVFKTHSWSKRSRNILEMLMVLGDAADVQKVEVLNATHRFSLPRFDQTLTPIGESGMISCANTSSSPDLTTEIPAHHGCNFPIKRYPFCLQNSDEG